MIDGSAPVLHRPSMMTEAQLLDAVAREQLGDQRAAEASLERALVIGWVTKAMRLAGGTTNR